MVFSAPAALGTSRRQMLGGALVAIAIALSVAYAFAALDARIDLQTPPGGPESMADLRDATWFPARFMAEGRNPYDVAEYAPEHPAAYAAYTPSHLLIWLPVAFVSWPGAVLVAILIQLLALVTFAVALARVLVGDKGLREGVPESSRWLAVTLWAAFSVGGLWVTRSYLVAFGAGNPSVVYGLAASLLTVLRKDGLGATVCLFLALQKPTFGLLAFVWVLGMRWWRAALWALSLTTVCSLTSILMMTTGGAGILRWFTSALTLSQGTQLDRIHGPTQSLWIDVSGWLGEFPSVAPRLTYAVAAALLVVTVLLFLSLRAVSRPTAGLALIQGGLLSVPHGGYDTFAMWAPLLMLALLGGPSLCRENNVGQRPPRRLLWSSMALSLLTMLFASRSLVDLLTSGLRPIDLQRWSLLAAFVLLAFTARFVEGGARSIATCEEASDGRQRDCHERTHGLVRRSGTNRSPVDGDESA